ncbi:MAG: Cu(I)-responsive transcriptional regulator CueR [Roseibaca calidilacus]|uniref:Cu(I)-responsive transcriptional regulator n=1 Tax=Roseibaca calidilacus TaxID=1666912 RepID=A0A0P8AMC3_9RHOB|nr:Cu(I)-responsive transcriptional regulator [Roseibaca calidilacus]KPP95829.1 MAG: Cu(I)-responsive transcriptional regulator CueR [Roseibaca calidilacus]CUX81639.1 Cu(I)-responsive transcriptional regulator [Roseibaca calidilacus]
MNISDAGKRSGLPPKTIRFYEEIGLITPTRQANGYRDFSEEDLHKLAFLRRARALGFTTEECRQLMGLYTDKSRASADVKSLATAHLARIDAQLAELQEMRRTLAHLVSACAGDARPDCPILSDLARE